MVRNLLLFVLNLSKRPNCCVRDSCIRFRGRLRRNKIDKKDVRKRLLFSKILCSLISKARATALLARITTVIGLIQL